MRDPHDAQAMAQRQGYLFQEYLGDPRSLEPYFATLRGPPPLFPRAQNTGHYSCQTVIAPNGDIAPVFVLRNELEYGMALSLTRISDASLEALTTAYARALAAEGALGPVNVQFRQDRHGSWKAQEINLRNTGSTLSRFVLGMDELYLIVRDFVPGVSFPEMRPAEIDRPDRVTKSLLVPGL